jgi:hypothetical protein
MNHLSSTSLITTSLTNTLNKMSISENVEHGQYKKQKTFDKQQCDQKTCDKQQCNKQCEKECANTNPFKVPKSYSEVLRDNKYLLTEHTELLSNHLETLKELELAKKTIRSLRELNTKLIDSNRDYSSAFKKVEEAKARIEEEKARIEEEKTKVEEQGKLFLRTYTNMSIEMLKMEEKLAKYENRVW